MKKVLATSWHPGGANAIIPVIKRLKAEEKLDVGVVGYEFSEKQFDNAGIFYRKIFDYGVNDVSADSMQTVLEIESPDLVLTGTSMQDNKNKNVIEQTITLVAGNASIPSLSVLDYWANYYQRFSYLDFISAGEYNLSQKFRFLPDKIAILDKYAKSDMLKEGFPEEKLVITGNPHFDGFRGKVKDFRDEDKKRVMQEIGLGGVLLFYAAGVFKEDVPKFGYWDLDNIKLVNEAIQEISGANSGLVAKLHPRVPKEDFNEISDYVNSNGKGRVKLVSDIHPNELSLTSDVTLTACSTVGIEAVLMGKPCISIQPNLKCQDYLEILTKNNISPVGYTRESCINLIKRVVSDSDYREKELVEKTSLFKVDGKATERVANLVYEMVGERNE